MPVVSRFLGIVIATVYRDHEPPHFHASYGDYEITVGIRDGVVAGRFPRRALQHVLEWADLHRDDLPANWDRARAKEPLLPVAPLECGPVFGPLRDPAAFAEALVDPELRTVAWSNGADFAPEYLRGLLRQRAAA